MDAPYRTIGARKDFLAANGAARVPMPAFVLLARPRGDGDTTRRLGITVTRKIGNAVVRNRVKRRFRALMRELMPEHGLSGADHVLIARNDVIERDFGQLKGELAKALGKAKQRMAA